MSDTLGRTEYVYNGLGPFCANRLSVKSHHKPALVVSPNL